MTKNTAIYMRVSQEDKAKFKQGAQNDQTSLSKWLTDLANQRCQKQERGNKKNG